MSQLEIEPRFNLTDDPVVMLRRMRAEGTLDMNLLAPKYRQILETADAMDAAWEAVHGNGHAEGAGHEPSKNVAESQSHGRQAAPSKTQGAPPDAACGGGTADPSAQTEAVPDAPQRNSKGQFTRGNSGGPGNPFGRYTAMLRSTFMQAATAEHMQQLATTLINFAIAGDLAAARLVLNYTIGKPAAAVDPDRMDLTEWDLWKAMAPMMAELTKLHLLKKPDAELPLTLVRATKPIITQTYGNSVGHVVSLSPKEQEKLWAKLAPLPPDEAERQLKEMSVAACRARAAAEAAEAEARNNASAAQPSPNGQEPADSPRGAAAPANPSPNGKNGHTANAARGATPPAPPSPIGDNGPKPSTTSVNEPVPAQHQNRRKTQAPPSPNGGVGKLRRQAFVPKSMRRDKKKRRAA